MTKIDLTPKETLTDLSSIKKAVLQLQKDVSEIKNLLKPFSQKEAQVNGHVEIIQRLIHQNLGTEPEQGFIGSEAFRDNSNPSDHLSSKKTVTISKSSKKNKNNIQLKKYTENSVLVVGKTYDNRFHIKDCGGRWEASETGWVLPSENFGDLVQKFKDNNIDHDFDENEMVFQKQEEENDNDTTNISNNMFRD